MKIQSSICADCKHFEHECSDDLDYICSEYCLHVEEIVRDRFYDEDDITECKGFEV